MAVATLERGNTSIDIPLKEERGEILVSSTFGKPEVQIRRSGGTLNPRALDQWSGLQNIQIVGKLFDYQTSHDLADLVKEASTTPLELTLPTSVYPDTITVAPSAGSDSALTLGYPSGRKNIIDVELTLTRVNKVFGVGGQSASTPTTSGSGPVEVRVGRTTIEVPSAGLSLSRSVGRPNDAVRRIPRQPDPRHEVKAKTTTDVFTLEFETVENIASTLRSITDNIFRAQLGRDGVTVDFNGMLGLGEIQAIPTGSSPFRQVHQAGRKDWVTVPTLEFRRIYDTR